MPGTLIDDRGRLVCEHCDVARSFRERARGLLGRKRLEPGEGLLIGRTGSIHTFFMAFPIDVVFLDRALRVREITRGVKPFRVAFRLGARSVLELAAGEAERVGLEVGARLAWRRL